MYPPSCLPVRDAIRRPAGFVLFFYFHQILRFSFCERHDIPDGGIEKTLDCFPGVESDMRSDENVGSSAPYFFPSRPIIPGPLIATFAIEPSLANFNDA